MMMLVTGMVTTAKEDSKGVEFVELEMSKWGIGEKLHNATDMVVMRMDSDGSGGVEEMIMMAQYYHSFVVIDQSLLLVVVVMTAKAVAAALDW